MGLPRRAEGPPGFRTSDLEDWFRTLDGLLGGEHPIRVRLAAAERLLRLGEALKKRGPGPGEKRSDMLLRMRLADLPMP